MQRRYSDREKVEALKILQKYNGDVAKTAAMTGFSERIVRRWKKTNVVKQSIEDPANNYSKEIAVIVADVEAKVDEMEKSILPRLYQSMEKAISRGNDLLAEEKDLNKVSMFLKTITDASNIIKPSNTQGPNNLQQFIQLINNQYVSND